VPCTLPSRITTKVLKLQDFFFKIETKTKNVQDQDQFQDFFVIQDQYQDFHFLSSRR